MKLLAPTLALAFITLTTTVHGQTTSTTGTLRPEPAGDIWRLMMSPATLHYHYNEDHRHVYMLGLERQRADGFILGASWFRNSFGQPSAYAYAGRRFENFTSYEPLFAQLTGGVLYGYKPPFENKVPLNHNGFSPGLVLSLGWQFTPMYSAQLNFLGNAALMLQFSVDLR